LNVKHVLDSLNLDQIRTQLENLYHSEGPGRKPINPLSMLKAQLTNTCYRYPLALRLRRDRRLARACGFRRWTPSHGLFTHFQHRPAYIIAFRRIWMS
jgi:hypothetical protein